MAYIRTEGKKEAKMTWVLYVAGMAVLEFFGPKAEAVCKTVGAMAEGSYGAAAICTVTVGA